MSEAILSGNADDTCPGCGRRLCDIDPNQELLAIPRTKLEAYEAAAITIEEATKFDDDQWRDGWKAIRTMLSWQLAALRAAGITEEG